MASRGGVQGRVELVLQSLQLCVTTGPGRVRATALLQNVNLVLNALDAAEACVAIMSVDI